MEAAIEGMLPKPKDIKVPKESRRGKEGYSPRASGSNLALPVSCKT